MNARERILAKLKKADAYPMLEPQTVDYYQEMSPSWENDVERLKHWAKAMRAVKTEIIWVQPENWTDALCQVVAQKGLNNILMPTKTESGKQGAAALQAQGIDVRTYDRKLEEWKEEFFADIQAGFTDVRCGIAHTGTLMLFPTPQEPRTQSLVPPVHICLFDTSKMYDTFYAAMIGENMAENMPTNVVLVSGPSKTADIQLTLAFGAHGPKDMVVLAILPPHIQAADLDDVAQ
ncbi:LutC/YkgG family protein [Neisseriaceae bacterium B1]